MPVCFNHGCHTRVAVAYDATHVLCLDSFGRLHAEEAGPVVWCAGMSLIPCDYLYLWVREAVICRGWQETVWNEGRGGLLQGPRLR